MIDRPGDHPSPHAELADQNPLLFVVEVGDALYRHHQKIYGPIFFGKTGTFRFDDPACPAPTAFGVLYAGADPECCLLEAGGATLGVPSVSGAYLDARAIAKIELTEQLRFVDLVADGGLSAISADARLMTGSYKIAQEWSRALRNHPSRPDGIRYRSRHAPERVAYAIYERPPTAFNVTSMGSFTDPANEALFKNVLKTYKIALL